METETNTPPKETLGTANTLTIPRNAANLKVLMNFTTTSCRARALTAVRLTWIAAPLLPHSKVRQCH